MAACHPLSLSSSNLACYSHSGSGDPKAGSLLALRRIFPRPSGASNVLYPRTRIHATSEEQTDIGATSLTTSDHGREDLAAKLAAAEAEAEALRRELAARRLGKEVDLSKLKPSTPEKRIDGTGYRETLFSGTGNAIGSSEELKNKWGLSEAELFLSKGAPTEGPGLGFSAVEDGANEIVTRRLIVGVGITILAVGLAFLKLPSGLVKPQKPLFFYLVPILHLRDQLRAIEDSSSDANSVRQRLQRATNTIEVSKETFLSAAGWLDGENAEQASSLTYVILDYLNQADYNKYFENLGPPSASQQLDFLKFSLQSVRAAREKVDEFLSLMPEDALVAAENSFNPKV